MSTFAVSPERSRRWSFLLALLMVLALAAQMARASFQGSSTFPSIPESVDSALNEIRDGFAKIIVQKWDPKDPAPERAVVKMGGEITLDLPIIDGFAATIPASSVDSLPQLPGARVVSLDRKVTPQADGEGSSVKSVFTKTVKADQMWSAGYRGAGVAVALIDTGVTEVADLAGRVLPVYDDTTGTYSACVNMSGESNCNDSYGHGTFLAGIIAGNGAASGGKYKGVAPEANIVSIKIAGRDGSADVSKVIAGIQWTTTFEGRYNIRVLNLSLGTDSTQSYRTDPLNYAVERAWDSGLVVVVSASNRGPNPGTIAKPGDDPWVITVGAVDDRGTAGLGDDRIPSFSSRGPTAADGLAKPDLAAPGAHMVSLRSVGSAIDTQFPNYIDGSYRMGSGTSMSAAVVSGAAALMLQADPNISPDRAKFALMATARGAASTDPMEVGEGVPHTYNATFDAPAGFANAGLPHSDGLGSLDASRGTVQVAADDPLSTVIGGALTAQLLLWDPISFTGSAWYGSAWYGSAWYGSAWYGLPEWYGSAWYGSAWYGSAWYGSAWYGSAWYGSAWYGQMDGSAWYGSAWYGSAWYGAWE